MTSIRGNAEPDIDAELLAEAQRQLGLPSVNETINVVLRRVVEDERARRRRSLERLQQMSDEGLFDFGAVDEADR
jgi:Arc/MetJ family transcription regulator